MKSLGGGEVNEDVLKGLKAGDKVLAVQTALGGKALDPQHGRRRSRRGERPPPALRGDTVGYNWSLRSQIGVVGGVKGGFGRLGSFGRYLFSVIRSPSIEILGRILQSAVLEGV